MKALTLRQPWPWAILRGGCPIVAVSDDSHEGLVGYTGTLALAAGRAYAPREHLLGVDGLTGYPGGNASLADASADLGGIVGTIRLAEGFHHSDDCQGICHPDGWGYPEGWHHEVEQLDRITLDRKVPHNGDLGLHDLDRATAYLVTLGARAGG